MVVTDSMLLSSFSEEDDDSASAAEGGQKVFSREALEKRSAKLEKELVAWKAAYDVLAQRLDDFEQAERELIYMRAKQGREEQDQGARELQMHRLNSQRYAELDRAAYELETYRRNYPRYVERLSLCETWRSVMEPEYEALKAKHAKCEDLSGEVNGMRERIKALEIELLRTPALVKAGKQELAKELDANWQEERRALLRRAEGDRDRMREDHQKTKDELSRVSEEAELRKLRVSGLEREVANKDRTIRKLERNAQAHASDAETIRASEAEAKQARETIASLQRAAEINRDNMAKNANRYEKVLQMYRDAMEREAFLKNAMDDLKISFSETAIGQENARLREIATKVTIQFQKSAHTNTLLRERLAEVESILQQAAIEQAASRGKVQKK